MNIDRAIDIGFRAVAGAVTGAVKLVRAIRAARRGDVPRVDDEPTQTTRARQAAEDEARERWGES